ncbi:MAG: GNAT family N-acetyltransferase [Phycisphaera sp.]|nr:GNAT family N-acetyltransferase [Phycisphaera sp.]
MTRARRFTLDTPAGPRHAEMRVTDIAGIIALRHAILRAPLPRDTAHFDGDDAPTTRHIGVFLLDADTDNIDNIDNIDNANDADPAPGDNVGCATFMLNNWRDAPAWQLRGMATRADLRGCGVGSAMLHFARAVLTDVAPHVTQLWCNARVPAAPFYEKLGWTIASDEFVIPTAGPHFRMTAVLASENDE